MADNDYTVGVQPFPGLFPAGHPASFIPMQWEGCWGGFHNDFCEVTTADRTYEFAYDESETKQGEITLISSLDGPLNFKLVITTMIILKKYLSGSNSSMELN